MNIWPWSRIRALERVIRITEAKLDVCGLAADGAFHHTVGPQWDSDGYNLHSPALVEVISLRRRYEALCKEFERPF